MTENNPALSALEIDIQLLPIREDDIEMVRNWRNLPEIAQFMYTEDQITSEQQAAWYNRIKDDSSQKYWIVGYKEFKFGVVSLYNIKPGFKSCAWAFYLDRRTMLKSLGNADFVHSRIGPKVEYQILRTVFEDMNFNKLYCEVLTTNEAVINMHEKYGFRREAYFREHIFKKERFYDVVSLAFLKSDWEMLKDAIKKIAYE